MGLEMIDGQQGQTARQSDGFSREQADEDPADQAGAGRGRYAAKIGKSEACLPQGGRDDGVGRLDMRARGDFGDDSGIGRVCLELAKHHIGQDFRGAIGRGQAHQSRRGFVAAGFNAQNDALAFHVVGS